jgi:hypothetical protein
MVFKSGNDLGRSHNTMLEEPVKTISPFGGGFL